MQTTILRQVSIRQNFYESKPSQTNKQRRKKKNSLSDVIPFHQWHHILSSKSGCNFLTQHTHKSWKVIIIHDGITNHCDTNVWYRLTGQYNGKEHHYSQYTSRTDEKDRRSSEWRERHIVHPSDRHRQQLLFPWEQTNNNNTDTRKHTNPQDRQISQDPPSLVTILFLMDDTENCSCVRSCVQECPAKIWRNICERLTAPISRENKQMTSVPPELSLCSWSLSQVLSLQSGFDCCSYILWLWRGSLWRLPIISIDREHTSIPTNPIIVIRAKIANLLCWNGTSPSGTRIHR
jgi:hypothetical protein